MKFAKQIFTYDGFIIININVYNKQYITIQMTKYYSYKQKQLSLVSQYRYLTALMRLKTNVTNPVVTHYLQGNLVGSLN